MNNSLLHPETGEPCCPNPCCLDQTLDTEMNLQQMEEFEAKRQTVRRKNSVCVGGRWLVRMWVGWVRRYAWCA